MIVSKGPTYGINGSFGLSEKSFSINFSKGNTKFCLCLHYNGISICYLEKKSLSLKPTIEILTFQLSFASKAIYWI